MAAILHVSALWPEFYTTMDAKQLNDRLPDTKSRRQFISLLGGATICTAIVPMVTLAASATRPLLGSRNLVFNHLHTGEKLHATYWHGGDYDATVLTLVDCVLRDFRTGDSHPIDRGLLDLLYTVQNELGVDTPYHVIGGYRSPKTNNMLRGRSTGVAKRSLHMEGRAIDVRLPGVNSLRLREVAADLRLGGVGYYRSSDFVHLDTGRPRVW
jgi:uncharacterized protein YcbK (DUF882 family)